MEKPEILVLQLGALADFNFNLSLGDLIAAPSTDISVSDSGAHGTHTQSSESAIDGLFGSRSKG